MYDVMEGIKVIEVAEHTFVPAASMILADWGADVIKIERAGGDPGRSLAIPDSDGNGFNMFFEAANRGKRSLGLDLNRSEGRALLYKLVAGADVFITNLRAPARQKLGIEPDQLMKINPRLIYARGTGYGLQGAMANHGGFDHPTAWCRSGAAYMQTRAEMEPPTQPGSVGDLCGGATTAGAVAAALFRRERTGKGTVVDNALYLFGCYMMSQSMVAASIGLPREPYPARDTGHNPLSNKYRTRDGRWIVLTFILDNDWWSDLARHLDREDLAEDPRFTSMRGRSENGQALMAELDAIFGARDFQYWIERLATLKGVWAPLFSPAEVIEDPQALVNGFITPVRADDGRSYMAGASPAQFDQRPIGALRAAPAYGGHSEAVLRELGLTADAIATLKDSGVIAAG